jgi:hypothetical protein
MAKPRGVDILVSLLTAAEVADTGLRFARGDSAPRCSRRGFRRDGTARAELLPRRRRPRGGPLPVRHRPLDERRRWVDALVT